MSNATANYFAKKRMGRALIYIFLTFWALLTLAPLWILLVNSFKGQAAIIDNPIAAPAAWSLEFITNAANQLHYASAIGYTFVITVFAVALIVLISSMAAWMLARNKTRSSTVVFMAFVAAMLVPFQVVMYPLVQIADAIGLKNAGGLILMYGGFGLSMSIFLYHGFVKSVPLSVEEASVIDGCSVFQTYLFVVMPLLKSITVTVIIINAMWVWNDYLLPFVVIGNSSGKTLVLALYFARITAGQYGNPWQLIFPAVLITILPILVVFLALQKYIVKGISAGAVKA
jgi:raffinose/stachyose/melibiose transport system permease protein